MNKNKLEIPSKEDIDKSVGKGGKLGSWFGVGDHARTNFAFIIMVILLFAGVALTFVNFNNSIEYWGKVTFLITFCAGYLFGKGRS